MATFTKTVVFTDIANYTLSTAKASREELVQLIENHEEHTKRIFDPHGGVLVKNLGDSFMAIFDSATSAINACLEIVESTIQLGDQQLAIRASLATGDVEEINGDYFGEAVNLSARINSKAPAGECWFANRTRLCMNQKEIPFETVGSFDFKGIPDSIECFRAVPQGQCIFPERVERQAKLGLLNFITPAQPPKASYSRSDIIIIRGYDITTPGFQQLLTKLPSHLPAENIFFLATTLPPLERKEWLHKGYGFIIGTETAFEETLQAYTQLPETGSSQTLFMDFGSQADVNIQTRGFAVRKPINGLMVSYYYDLLKDGSWGYQQSNDGILKVDVHSDQVYVTAYEAGVTYNNTPLSQGVPVEINQAGQLQTSIGQILVVGMNNRDYRWLLVGAPTQPQEANVGDIIELGREPGHPGYLLSERVHNRGIVWAASDNAKLAARSGYTLDRIIIGRQQARVSIDSPDRFTLSSVHKRIPTLVVNQDVLLTVSVSNPIAIQPNALFIVGTRLLEVAQS